MISTCGFKAEASAHVGSQEGDQNLLCPFNLHLFHSSYPIKHHKFGQQYCDLLK